MMKTTCYVCGVSEDETALLLHDNGGYYCQDHFPKPVIPEVEYVYHYTLTWENKFDVVHLYGVAKVPYRIVDPEHYKELVCLIQESNRGKLPNSFSRRTPSTFKMTSLSFLHEVRNEEINK